MREKSKIINQQIFIPLCAEEGVINYLVACKYQSSFPVRLAHRTLTRLAQALAGLRRAPGAVPGP